MAYAQLALLDVQFGLYSSFMGVLIYWFFATSKDITIGVCLRMNVYDFHSTTLTSILARWCHVFSHWECCHASQGDD